MACSREQLRAESDLHDDREWRSTAILRDRRGRVAWTLLRYITPESNEEITLRTPQSTLRLIPELRNYHVALAPALRSSESFYFDRKYDLDGDEPAGFERITLTGALRRVLSRRYTELVIWEPLWVRMLPRHVLLVLAWRLRTLRARPVMSYAMENNDLRSLMVGRGAIPKWVVRTFAMILGVYLRATYSRFAYASEGSAAIYRALPFVSSIASSVIPNLPQRRELVKRGARGGPVVMVARMEARKGTDVIMRAWPEVEAALPAARIVVIGGGPEEEAMAAWAKERSASRSFLGALPHHRVLEQVADASVLVLPSVRDGRWREQIGLPIHEALMNGLTVVTTDETGLAQMLSHAGHIVVPAAHVLEQLPAALQQAITAPLPREDVVSILPDEDGRVLADRWMRAARDA